VNSRRMILVASIAILAALFFAGAAQPQALILGTDGQAGDNAQTLEAVSASLENDDSSVAASAGKGQGSAATVDVQKGTDSGTAVVGCIDASAASGANGGSLSVGNCGGGSAGGANLGNGAAGGDGGAGIDLGCIVAELFGVGSGGAQVGSCDEGAGGSGGGDEEGGAAGDIGGNADEDQGNGVAGADAGAGAGVEGDTGSGDSGSGDGQGGGDEPCGTFAQTSALTGSGALPFWTLGLAAIGAFGLGTFFARRRKGVDPTG
jgi:hypothetical protein